MSRTAPQPFQPMLASARRAPAPVASGRLTITPAFLLLLMFLSVSFYFRSEEAGGGIAQYLFISGFWFFGLCAGVAILKQPVAVSDRGSAQFRTMLAAIVAMSCLSAFLNGVPFGDFIRVELRILAFCFAGYLLSNYLLRGGDVRKLTSIVLISTLAYALFSAFNEIVIRGTDLFAARYHLLPGAGVLVLSFLVPTVHLTGWKGLRRALPAILILALLVLSQTRSAMLGFVVAVALHCLFLFRWGQSSRLAAIVLTGVAGVLVLLAASSTALVEHWNSRLTVARGFSQDPTALTRIAEYRNQMSQLGESAERLLFGAGPGARYDWDYSVAREVVASGMVERTAGDRSFDFGHSLYVYSIFSMGLLGGFLIPVVLVGGFLRAMRASLGSKTMDPQVRRIYHQTWLALGALLTMSLASHPIADWQFGSVIATMLAIAYLEPKTLAALLQGRNGRRPVAAATPERLHHAPVPAARTLARPPAGRPERLGRG